MGRDVSGKLKFTTPDKDVFEGKIPEQRWSPGPEEALEALDVDVYVHTIVNYGDYRVPINVTVSLEEIMRHDCIWVSDDMRFFCKNKRRVFFRSIVADIHAFRYFADCMNRKKMRVVVHILPAVECEKHIAILLPEADVIEVVDELEASEKFLPSEIMDNICSFLDPDTSDWCSWLEVHDKHAGVFYDPDAKYGVKYQNFLAVEIDFAEEFFEECEDVSRYMYPDCMIESEVMIRMEGYVDHD